MIVPCPACTDEVRVPYGLSESARVRCPLCREEFQLDEALAELPPLLEVIDPGMPVELGRASMPSRAGGDDVELEDDEAPDVVSLPGLAPAPERTASPFSLAGPSAPAAAGTKVGPTTGVKARRTSKRKVSPLREVIKVALGGVIGLSIGQLVLFWLPGNFKAQQRDPFQLGPKLSNYVPWIVPQSLRGGVAAASGEQASSDTGADDPGAQGASILETAGNEAVAQRPSNAGGVGDIDLSRVGMNAQNNATGGGSPGTAPGASTGDVGLEPGLTPDPGLELGATTPDPNDLGIALDPSVGAPATTAGGELTEALFAMKQADSEWKLNRDRLPLSSEEGKALFGKFYASLADVGQRLATGEGRSAERTRSELRELASLWRDDPGKTLDILQSYGARIWLTNAARENSGIALAGVLEQVGMHDDQPVVRIKLFNDETILAICSAPHDGSYETGDRALVLGELADAAAAGIDGEPQVIRGALVIGPRGR